MSEGMKTILVLLAASLVACAAPSGEDEGSETESQPLINNSGLPDRDYCEATHAACIQSCNGKAWDCFRFCDIQYEKCRGLPPSTVTYAR